MKSPVQVNAWPRGLSEPLAAAYVGLSTGTIRSLWGAGQFPHPVRLTAGRQVWLREHLDKWLDGKAGVTDTFWPDA